MANRHSTCAVLAPSLSDTATGAHRAIASDPELNAVGAVVTALGSVVETFTAARLGTTEGCEQAARLLQLKLAQRGWFLVREPADFYGKGGAQ